MAITAGQLASITANKQGPTGPFTVSILFLLLGSILAAFRWKENKAAIATGASEKSSEEKLTIKDAWDEMLKDKKIMLVGAVQALFEGAVNASIMFTYFKYYLLS